MLSIHLLVHRQTYKQARRHALQHLHPGRPRHKHPATLKQCVDGMSMPTTSKQVVRTNLRALQQRRFPIYHLHYVLGNSR
jgi:hypothetical protein